MKKIIKMLSIFRKAKKSSFYNFISYYIIYKDNFNNIELIDIIFFFVLFIIPSIYIPNIIANLALVV